ncbi:MAG: hypothetical protein COA50_04940 [Flavobacteriaceae bacterium]|nr:MAG: hypothetical protein COA50_04940 [Flavobacteriaceae bacterium]
MKFNLRIFKMIMLLLIVAGLYVFSGKRSNSKIVSGLKVEFSGSENLYLTHESVDKLLIQNYGSLKNLAKEDLALNTIEMVIETNEMVKSAQVYLTIDGRLTSEIVQRRPIGRVEGITKFYVDDEGKRMPLSKYHSARVPIITGEVTGKSLEDVFAILKYINSDDFLHKNVIGMHVVDNDKYQLKFRMENFTVNLGSVDGLEAKFNNFKAFYAKANKDETLGKYNMVSLEFNNQVVCTKI